jgi:hypothetical protein
MLYVIFKREKCMFNPTNNKYVTEIPRSTNNINIGTTVLKILKSVMIVPVYEPDKVAF